MPPRRERIVVIDDNMNDVQFIQRVLERKGYEVSWATSGEAGLVIAAEKAPDCILVDYHMPGMDGYEVARRVKSDKRLQTVPVLMLTGADSAENIIGGLEAGADDFVVKGSDIEVLLARVRALLRVKAYQDRIVEQAEQMRSLYEEIKQKSDKIYALNQRMSKDLDIARKVQEALVPRGEFHSSQLEILSAYIPSETLSGDFYDYFIHQDLTYLFLADVSGHGLPAAILVSLLKSYIHTETDATASLADFMTGLNDFLFTASLPTQFATAQLFRLDGAGTLRYSNAAHPPFLLFQKSKGRTEMFEEPGHLLGAMPGMNFEEHAISVESGDTLFTYTDGLTDRRDSSGVFYAIERVAAILERSAGRSVSHMYKAIYDDVAGFAATDEFKDDIAFVVTRFK
jgi:serine phosphatase RsbU (regulator of sigma subunit)